VKLMFLEIWFFVQVPLVWYLLKRFAGCDVSGMMIAGIVLGSFNEFATEPLWDYHFCITVYKDVPLGVLLGWGVLFSLVTFISEKLYRFFLKRKIEEGDKRVFIFDILAGILFAFPVETLSLKLGIWDYNYGILNWNWGEVPLFNMPLEALFGYCLFMLVGPSFVRSWEKHFRLFSKRGDRETDIA